MAVPEDCTTCGACCFSDEPNYIGVFAVDRKRMDEAARALTEVCGDGHFMRFEAGRCVALVRDRERLICKIYESRPDACRWLERGSGMCRDVLSKA